jgi:putative transposase
VREPRTELFLHLVWATWNRLPLIGEANEKEIYAAIAKKCREHKCTPLAIGGVHDHVHVLVQLHPTVAISTLVKEVKGASSHLANHEISPGHFFKWQGAYGAFTLSKADVPAVIAYIRRQKNHHARGSLVDMWESADNSWAEQPT